MPGPQLARLCIGALLLEATPISLHVDATGPVELSREEALELRNFLDAQYPAESSSVSDNDRSPALR